ncbi:uncharacterized protein LOC127098113 isoform X3 [Lathyrus oleraceus]|uniref:uncharacterized protein LOC127098113 isoform X1 n=1 Tax=Pisum sativum TaxID=3888 RepID=UPI0021D3AA36|nr:uncharacterized protein LOC127098113 isoform X1 [Pisum sativum]XP_050892575.1 uncharacterized protein LOC127098113 isoform X2 [Pisum sativum]XP_050892576.1 uncharacterized protein LOC127098113 isoform X3 [Pisum sativum]
MGDSSSSSSASYIHLVQHLIEKCLIFHMTKEECMEALSKHAHINPIITSTEQWNVAYKAVASLVPHPLSETRQIIS